MSNYLTSSEISKPKTRLELDSDKNAHTAPGASPRVGAGSDVARQMNLEEDALSGADESEANPESDPLDEQAYESDTDSQPSLSDEPAATETPASEPINERLRRAFSKKEPKAPPPPPDDWDKSNVSEEEDKPVDRDLPKADFTPQMEAALLACMIAAPDKFMEYMRDGHRMFSGDTPFNMFWQFRLLLEKAIRPTLIAIREQVVRKYKQAHATDKDYAEILQEIENYANKVGGIDVEREMEGVLFNIGPWHRQAVHKWALHAYAHSLSEADEMVTEHQKSEHRKKHTKIRHELIQALEEADAPIKADKAISLKELYQQPVDESKTLLGNRFLCNEGGCLFVGPSGVGKSSASMQQDVCWACGREAFGIKPARPLRILTIQSENDKGDLTEMLNGVADGLNLSKEELELVWKNVLYIPHDTLFGMEALTGVVRPWLRKFPADILRLDPLNGFLGGDPSDAKIVTPFVRLGLNALTKQFKCGVILNHHTPKINNRDTSKWRPSDWAYAGAGNNDLTNWARSIIVIDPTADPSVYRFIAAKRGRRVGWLNEFEEPTIFRWFRHGRSMEGMYWQDASEEDVAKAKESQESHLGGAPEKYPDATLLEALPLEDAITATEWLARLKMSGCGISKSNLPVRAEMLRQSGKVERVGKKWKRGSE